MHAHLILRGAHRAERVRPIEMRSLTLYAAFTFHALVRTYGGIIRAREKSC